MLSWLKKLLPKKSKEPDNTYIWGVLEGPYYSREIPDCNFPPEHTMLVVKMSRGEEVFDAEIWFEDIEAAYVLMKHFRSSIEPIQLNNKEP